MSSKQLRRYEQTGTHPKNGKPYRLEGDLEERLTVELEATGAELAHEKTAQALC
jgi:hypothetical protein